MPESLKFFILDVSQRGQDSNEILLWGKTERGEPALVIDRSFHPFFFIEYKATLKDDDVEELSRKVSELSIEGIKPLKVGPVTRRFFGKEKNLLKIELPRPSDAIRFREKLKDWMEVKAMHEQSLTFYRRYLLERQVRPMSWVEVEGVSSTDGSYAIISSSSITPCEDTELPRLSIMAMDIELVEENDEEKIIMVSVKDNRGFRKVISYKKADVGFLEVVSDEKALIVRLMEIVRARDPDIITTYNGDRFDFKHLIDRSAKHKIGLVLGRTDKHAMLKKRGRFYAAWIEGRVHVDAYEFVDNILSDTLSSDSKSLDSVSREIIGRGKRKMEWDDLQKAWEESSGLERIVKYCMTDSELTLSLTKTFIPQMAELCRIVGQGLFDINRMTYSQLVEWMLMRETRKAGELIPERPNYDVIQIRRKAASYEGGYVFPPKEGIHKNIALFDFMSLYPSITITHNISPETLNCHCCNGSDDGPVHKVPGKEYFFCKTHAGFVSRTLKDIVEKRRELKAELMKKSRDSEEYRSIYNRQYALKILANASYGYYGYAGSRWYSRVCAQSITAWGRYYIQRVMRRVENLGYEVIYGDTDSLFVKLRSKKSALELLDGVNKTLPGAMELEFQGIYRAGIFVPAKTGLAAKKRYALVDRNDEMVIRGFEIVRRDWSPIARETQEKILMAILRDDSEDEALSIARRAINRIQKEAVPMEKMIIHTQLTRPLKDYEQTGPHIAAARKALSRGRPVAQGSMISYVITKGSGSISERAEPAEDATNYDPDYYINNQVVPTALRVLAALGYTEEDIITDGDTQSSLSNFIRKGRR
ncbi:MAG: hypothetical protein JW789_04620 [Candidatus Aenigmarchaeota archaeon]|nr:hypothetical protein [Candidatus Aenigmarchaeota archaeon]